MTNEGAESPPADPIEPNLPKSVESAGRATATARFRHLMGSGVGSRGPRRSSVVVSSDPPEELKQSAPPTRNEVHDEAASSNSPRSGFSWSRGSYRVRRVRRLVRHVEPWSVLKVGLIFYLCVWGLFVITIRTLWKTAEDGGTIEKVESFIEDLFALESFEFDTGQLFRLFTIGGLVLVVGGTAVTVVLVILFNLISDLTGGVRFTMVEEETAVRQRKLRPGDELIADPSSSPSQRESRKSGSG